MACERAGRGTAGVRLVAITKGVDPAHIEEALAAGISDVGENRVQEAARKQPEVTSSVTWHMVGHVQSNKAGRVASMFDVVQSIDDEQIARMLGERRDRARAPIAALIEVDLTEMPRRTGARAEHLEMLVAAVAGFAGIRVTGLMTIAPPGGPDSARPYFGRLRELRDRVETATGRELPELSMGMSDDFEVAVEEGATMVRVGRAIFGRYP